MAVATVGAAVIAATTHAHGGEPPVRAVPPPPLLSAPASSSTGLPPGEVIGGVIGHGPFDAGLHETSTVLWAAVALLIASSLLIGTAVVTFSLDTAVARAFLGASLPVGFLGLALAHRHHIMSVVD